MEPDRTTGLPPQGAARVRLFATGLLAVCLLLAGGLALTAILSHRAARRAAEDVLFSRASEVAATFVATARVTGALLDDARLQKLAVETAVDEVSIAVIDRDGQVVIGAGGGARGPRLGAKVPLGFELFRDLTTQGQSHRMVDGRALEYWRPIPGAGGIGGGWGRRFLQRQIRRWFDLPRHDRPPEQRHEEPDDRPPPSPPTDGGGDASARAPGPPGGAEPRAGKRPPWPGAGNIGLRLMRVTVPAALADPLLQPARLTLTLAAVAAVLLLALGLLLHRGARRAQRAEAELQRRRALSALGEMAAVLAHEIRTPLASMKGNAQLVGESQPADERVQSIVDEAGRLERLVNGLLDYARPSALRRAMCDPDALVQRAAQIVAPRAAATAVNLITDPAGCGACLHADADQLLQVLVNLLQNAVEATAGPGGRPAEPVVIAARRAGGRVTFNIQDAGPGLPDGPRDQIFRPFHSTKKEGTGLGLSVARQIVEQHGGELELEGRKEGGVVARVVLPEGGV